MRCVCVLCTVRAGANLNLGGPLVADRACAVPGLQLFEFFALPGDLVSNLRSVSTSLLPIRVFLCDGHIYIPPHRCCASTTMHIRSSLARLLFMKGSRSYQQALLRKQSGATTHCCKSFVSGRRRLFSDTRWPTAADRGSRASHQRIATTRCSMSRKASSL